MEIAKLILSYIETLIWPVIAIIVILLFKNHISALFKRFLAGNEYELKLGGNHLKIKGVENITEDLVKEISEVTLEKSKEEKIGKSIDDIRVLANLDNDAVVDLNRIGKMAPGEALWEPHSELIRHGLVDGPIQCSNGGYWRLSEIGRRFYNTINFKILREERRKKDEQNMP